MSSEESGATSDLLVALTILVVLDLFYVAVVLAASLLFRIAAVLSTPLLLLNLTMAVSELNQNV